MVKKQVFFDASGVRSRWTTRTVAAGYLALLAISAVFSATIVDLPRPAPLALLMERPRLHATPSEVRAVRPAAASFAAAPLAAAPPGARPLCVGFYVPWDESSVASLTRHIGELDWFIAGLISVTGSQHRVTVARDPRLEAALARATAPLAVLPMVRNAVEDDWDGDGAATMLRDPATRTAVLERVATVARARRAPGAVFDLEQLPDDAQTDYLRWLREARARLHADGQKLVVVAPADASDWRLRLLAAVADTVVVKLFGQHDEGTAPGPLAGQPWFAAQLRRAVADVGARRLVVAVGGFAQDWAAGADAETLSIEEAWLAARDSKAAIAFDPASGNATFAYEDGTRTHGVWLLDAASQWNQLHTAHAAGVAGLALWRLGGEDDGFWRALRQVGRPGAPDLTRLRSLSNVDVEGRGEILRIEAVPTDGAHTLRMNADGMIVDERYARLPTPYVVRRMGDRPGLVALTSTTDPMPNGHRASCASCAPSTCPRRSS